MSESTRQAPVSPYGWSKGYCEQIIRDHSLAHPGFSATLLRYFNACDASLDGLIGEDHDPKPHLIPIILKVAGDLPTPDGSCIRDYIHVLDLAEAHLKALEKLQPGGVNLFNLGSGKGFSVREIVDAARVVTGHPIPCKIAPPRQGDAVALWADGSKARQDLDWRPSHSDLATILSSAWQYKCRQFKN